MKKYEFVESNKIEVDGRVLTRIRALVDIPQLNVKAGDLGGYIEKESNLSHEGGCWVGGNARVFGDARVCNNAQVYGDARVFGDARVCDNAHVFDDAQAFGDARVFGNAQVFDDAQMFDDAWVSGYAWVSGNSQVSGNARVFGAAQVFGDAHVFDDAQVYGNAWVSGNSRVYGNAEVSGEVPNDIVSIDGTDTNESHHNLKDFSSEEHKNEFNVLVSRAIEILREHSVSIKECHTFPINSNNWNDHVEACDEYNEYVNLANKLEKFIQS